MLLLYLLVLIDLPLDVLLVCRKCALSLSVNLIISFRDVSLLLEEDHELLALHLSLADGLDLLLEELSLSGLLKIGQEAHLLFHFEFLSSSGFSLALLKGSSGTDSVDISLSVGGSLL